MNFWKLLIILIFFKYFKFLKLFSRNLVSLCLHIDMDQRITKVYNGAYSNNSQIIPGNKILYKNDNVCDILHNLL